MYTGCPEKAERWINFSTLRAESDYICLRKIKSNIFRSIIENDTKIIKFDCT